MQNGTLPPIFEQWFAQQGWQLRDYQAHMLSQARANRSTLLVAPTGAGKTLSGFLATLCELNETPQTAAAPISHH